jgi:hypothetical protein
MRLKLDMKLIILILTVGFTLNVFSQSTNKNVYFSENGVDIYLHFADCISPEKGTAMQYLFIEINNSTTSEIKISLDKEIWYDNVCQTCNSNSSEYKIDLKIPANNSIKGDCDSKNKSLRIFSKMLTLDNVRQLTKYELKNIKIENVK